MVGVVHWFEAAFVYPPLYAHKMNLHPLLVLVALYATEHLVGVQVTTTSEMVVIGSGESHGESGGECGSGWWW
jgi:hypothetical protein